MITASTITLIGYGTFGVIQAIRYANHMQRTVMSKPPKRSLNGIQHIIIKHVIPAPNAKLELTNLDDFYYAPINQAVLTDSADGRITRPRDRKNGYYYTIKNLPYSYCVNQIFNNCHRDLPLTTCSNVLLLVGDLFYPYIIDYDNKRFILADLDHLKRCSYREGFLRYPFCVMSLFFGLLLFYSQPIYLLASDIFENIGKT